MLKMLDLVYRLLGSTGSLYLDQKQGDIYFHNYYERDGSNFRIVLVTITWGVSIALIQFSANPRGNLPWWFVASSLVHLDVLEFGQQHQDEPHVPTPLPNSPPIVNGEPVYTSLYAVPGRIYMGWTIRWHHDVRIHRSTRHNAPQFLHYHQHAKRTGHSPFVTPILPRDAGSYLQLTQLGFRTQVQNSRGAWI